MAQKKSLVSGFATKKASDAALNRAFDQDGNPTEGFQKAILKAIDIQRPLVLANIQRLRRKYPEDTPEQLAERLATQYVNTITGAGAAVGGSAVIPGIGTAAALGLSAAATLGFLEASALYAQSIAELHGVSTEDPQRAQTLVMSVMLGDDGRKLLKDFASQSRGLGGGPVAGLMSVSAGGGVGDMIFQQIKRRFLKKFFVQQGAGFLGRAVPFGIGAVIGGIGNRTMGKAVVRNAETMFGELPAAVPAALEPAVKGEEAEKDAKGGPKDKGKDKKDEKKARSKKDRKALEA